MATTGFNKVIAVAPPENNGVERKIVGGVAQTLHKSALTGLKVVFGTPELPAGSTVYVRSELVANQKWALESHELYGQRFVLMPEANVVLVTRE